MAVGGVDPEGRSPLREPQGPVREVAVPRLADDLVLVAFDPRGQRMGGLGSWLDALLVGGDLFDALLDGATLPEGEQALSQMVRDLAPQRAAPAIAAAVAAGTFAVEERRVLLLLRSRHLRLCKPADRAAATARVLAGLDHAVADRDGALALLAARAPLADEAFGSRRARRSALDRLRRNLPPAWCDLHGAVVRVVREAS
jgi:hypothetical protein